MQTQSRRQRRRRQRITREVPSRSLRTIRTRTRQQKERSQRDPREIPERFLARTLYRERTPRGPEPREIPERSQRDPERDPTSLHRVSDPRISPPRLTLYNVYTQEGWGPTVRHCVDPSASDGCTCQSPCNFALSPLTNRLLKTKFFFDGG